MLLFKFAGVLIKPAESCVDETEFQADTAKLEQFVKYVHVS